MTAVYDYGIIQLSATQPQLSATLRLWHHTSAPFYSSLLCSDAVLALDLALALAPPLALALALPLAMAQAVALAPAVAPAVALALALALALLYSPLGLWL